MSLPKFHVDVWVVGELFEPLTHALLHDGADLEIVTMMRLWWHLNLVTNATNKAASHHSGDCDGVILARERLNQRMTSPVMSPLHTEPVNYARAD
eukprot:3808655-Amphidinium_carterae.1